MDIYLIRHTRVAVESSLCYGQTDIPLAETFEQDVLSLQQRLQNIYWDAIYASPLIRCIRLLPYFPCASVIQDKRLMEMNFGKWELLSWQEIDPSLLHHWSNDFVHDKVPGGETYLELYERVVACWEEIIAKGHQGSVAVITHGGVIRAVLSYILSIPLQKSFHLDISYGSVSCIQVHPHFCKVLYINRV